MSHPRKFLELSNVENRVKYRTIRGSDIYCCLRACEFGYFTRTGRLNLLVRISGEELFFYFFNSGSRWIPITCGGVPLRRGTRAAGYTCGGVSMRRGIHAAGYPWGGQRRRIAEVARLASHVVIDAFVVQKALAGLGLPAICMKFDICPRQVQSSSVFSPHVRYIELFPPGTITSRIIPQVHNRSRKN